MITNSEAGSGDLKTAVKNALKLLVEGETDLARAQADEILRHYPDEINSQYIVAAALRAQGNLEAAQQCLQGLVQRAPDFALAQQELGFCYAASNHSRMAAFGRKRTLSRPSYNAKKMAIACVTEMTLPACL